MTVTLEEMKKDKASMEEEFFNHIKEFEKVYGVEVDLVEVNHNRTKGEKQGELFKVHVQVRVP